jgi:acyl-CoA synthetase (AMP-forming)/AMP-acid ligase II/acyl carrier protein
VNTGRETTVYGLLRASAERRPDCPAIIAPGRDPMTYRMLLDHIDDLRGRLCAMGFGPASRLAMILPNGPEAAVAFLAAASCAVAAPLNPAYRDSELEFHLSDLRADAVIVLDRGESAAIRVTRSMGIRLLPVAINPSSARGWLQLTDCDAAAANIFHEAPASNHPALLLHTSGTTSRPKLVSLSQSNLAASAYNIAGWLGLSPADRCFNIMPLFHIHGLVGALLSSFAGGGSIVCGGFVAPTFLAALHAFRPTWYTAVPTMHQAILAQGEANPSMCAATSLRLIRSSSAALAPQVAAGLERLFGVPVVEAYGMTEAAHQICCNPLPPAPRKFGSVGLPAGPEVAVMNEHGQLLARGEAGEIVIRGENVTSGYEKNPEANLVAFSNGWFRTGDLGKVDERGYVILAGRIKEIINRGGEKISPRQVDEVLLEHSAVAAAVTFAIPDSRLGEEIAAAIVLRDGATITAHELMQFVAARIADFKVPRRIVFVNKIPQGPTGKVQRLGLARQLGIAAAAPEHGGAQSDRALSDDESALASIWCEVLNLSSVKASDNFQLLGGDSLLAAQVISRVQSRMARKLSILAFFTSPTLESVAAAIEPATPVARVGR